MDRWIIFRERKNRSLQSRRLYVHKNVYLKYMRIVDNTADADTSRYPTVN